MSRITRSGWAAACAAQIIAAAGGCAKDQAPVRSETMAAAAIAPTPPDCRAPADRPKPGEAEMVESPDGGGILVRYSATPADAPCETLDISFRKRSEMLIGEPEQQIRVVWSAERALADGAGMSVVAGGSSIALVSELKRIGSRAYVSSSGPVATLAAYVSERTPTFVIADRKIELSSRQMTPLRSFVAAVPGHRIPVGRTGASADRAAPPPRREDPAAGSGWFCAEEQSGEPPRQRTSSCHRTAAECEESRARIRASEGSAGECISSSAAQCYEWRTAADSGRSCFYRPSQCAREMRRRMDGEPGAVTVYCDVAR